jgi:hypothetical protein
MKKENGAVSSREDGKGLCSQTFSLTHGSAAGERAPPGLTVPREQQQTRSATSALGRQLAVLWLEHSTTLLLIVMVNLDIIFR